AVLGGVPTPAGSRSTRQAAKIPKAIRVAIKKVRVARRDITIRELTGQSIGWCLKIQNLQPFTTGKRYPFGRDCDLSQSVGRRTRGGSWGGGRDEANVELATAHYGMQSPLKSFTRQSITYSAIRGTARALREVTRF